MNMVPRSASIGGRRAIAAEGSVQRTDAVRDARSKPGQSVPPPPSSALPIRHLRWAVPVLSVVALTLPAAALREGSDVAPELLFPSILGEVVFPHKAHFNDMEISCRSCHHETNARALDIPHEEYFADFWIDCTTCHHPSSEPREAMSCSACHRCPVHCADETLSSKVVIHASCWGCHEIGTGAEASAGCVLCHSGPKQAWGAEEAP